MATVGEKGLYDMHTLILTGQFFHGKDYTVYQQPFETYLYRPISAAVSKLNYLAGFLALIYHSMCMIA